VNLPMLLKLANLRNPSDLRTAARIIREHGQAAVWVASDLLERK
jgi:hypothetical protein